MNRSQYEADAGKKKKELEAGIGSFVIVALICLAIIIFFSISLAVNSKNKVKKLEDEMVEIGEFLPENEGKLVMISGNLTIKDGGVISDDEYGPRLTNAFEYNRVPYQKVYFLDSSTTVLEHDINDPYDDETITSYFVSKHWIIANHARDAEVTYGKSYENPPAAKFEEKLVLVPFELAGFEIPYTDISSCVKYSNESFSKEELGTICEDWLSATKYDFDIVEDEDGNAYFSTGDDIGDIHIRFSYKVLDEMGPVTIIGKQEGNKLVTYGEGFDDEFHVLEGAVSKAEFLQDRDAQDSGDRVVCIVIIAIMLAIIVGAAVIFIVIPSVKNRS